MDPITPMRSLVLPTAAILAAAAIGMSAGPVREEAAAQAPGRQLPPSIGVGPRRSVPAIEHGLPDRDPQVSPLTDDGIVIKLDVNVTIEVGRRPLPHQPQHALVDATLTIPSPHAIGTRIPGTRIKEPHRKGMDTCER